MSKLINFPSLLELVSPDFLKDLLTRFTEATGVKTLITDNLGKPLIAADCPDGLFCKFCARMRANPKTRIQCEKSDAFAGISAFHNRQPFIYRCPMNFVEVAVPIVINDQFFGVIMIGQLQLEEKEHNAVVKNFSTSIEFEWSQELKALYTARKNEVPLIPLSRLRALANMLHSVANYITEISVNSFLKDVNDQLSMQIQHEEDYKKELKKHLKQSELCNIENHLKPQYLFDVLNTIDNLVLLENPQRASEVISYLSKLMRYTLHRNDQCSTIGEEFESIQDYLKIRALSSEDNILIQTTVDKDYFNAIIPSFAIQALVENAFTHGLASKLDGGSFYLEISNRENKINIIVSDNGVGMPSLTKSQLVALTKSSFSNSAPFTLVNIIKVLNYYFGDEFSWDINSSENQGTTITFMIPYWPKEGGLVINDKNYGS